MKKDINILSITLFVSAFALLCSMSVHAQVGYDVENEAAAVYNAEEEANEDPIANADDIDMPTGLTDELDHLLLEWNNRNYLVPSDDCTDTGINPEFDKETIINRLQQLPNVIEMPYNDVVRKFIDQYTGRLRRTVSIMLGANTFYSHIFEEALAAYQLPLELKYLPVIESALDPTAVSRAGAVGLWQFIISTGKSYGLEITSLIDERRDPIRSSYAAARYLRDLYTIFGDWSLVLAAYNCGPGNVHKAIARSGGQRDYWRIYPYLPRETRGYVPAFIAANYAMTYYSEHGICPMGTLLPVSTDTLHIHRNLHFTQISELCNVNPEEIRALNPQYKTGLIPGEGRECILRLPTAAISTFIEWGDSVYLHRADELINRRRETVVADDVKGRGGRHRGGTKYITVRRGETLGSIARRYGTTVARLRSLNGIRGNNVRAGRKLRVR